MEKRIDVKVSRTAQWIVISRAASFTEKDKYYKSEDFLAPVFIPDIEKPLRKFLLKFICRNIVPKGSYEHIIARTKYFDYLFETLKPDIKQVVIFGAGFDTRAIRFKNILKDKTVFELDSIHTQNEKIKCLQSKNIDIPINIIYIPADFDKDNFEHKLIEKGFKSGKKTMFLLEGLTMYLLHETIDRLYGFIKNNSSQKSIIAFDYLMQSSIENKDGYKGKNRIIKAAAKAGEKCVFGIEENKLEGFLEKYNIKKIDESDSKTLEDRFFKDENGKIKGEIKGSHGILVTAELI